MSDAPLTRAIGIDREQLEEPVHHAAEDEAAAVRRPARVVPLFRRRRYTHWMRTIRVLTKMSRVFLKLLYASASRPATRRDAPRLRGSGV
jgi:hypothetical protein